MRDSLQEVSGELPDGTPYLIRVPADWNGTVLIDHDYAAGGDRQPHWDWLYAQGYAGAGTTRNVVGFDMRRAMANQNLTLDIFEEAIGEPERIIASGASGGGQAAALMAQHYPERIDGAVPVCGSLSGFVAVLNVNQLDTTFALKALLDDGDRLPVVDLPTDAQASVALWTDALAQAQATAEGRARIALGAVIGQLPAWSTRAMPEPDPSDAHAVQEGLYLAVTDGGVIRRAMGRHEIEAISAIQLACTHAATNGGVIRRAMGRHAIEDISGGNPTWNIGVDYREIFELGDPDLRSAVESLYAEAGLDLDADLDAINAAPRVVPDLDAIEYFHDGHSYDGRLEVPVFVMSNIGDPSTTVTMVEAYERKIIAEGRQDLLRTSYVHSASHCNFTAAERAVAIDVLSERLDTGQWPDTSPAALTARATTLDLDGSRFIDYTPAPFSRPFYVGDPYPELPAPTDPQPTADPTENPTPAPTPSDQTPSPTGPDDDADDAAGDGAAGDGAGPGGVPADGSGAPAPGGRLPDTGAPMAGLLFGAAALLTGGALVRRRFRTQ